MLDVHPPHHAATTWRDFFIHIATIVIGLLIAVGLEQTVEYFHHRHQVAETRELLRNEREDNRQALTRAIKSFRVVSAELQNNLQVLTYLQQHPGTPDEKLPGALVVMGKPSSTKASPGKRPRVPASRVLCPAKKSPKCKVVRSASQDRRLQPRHMARNH